MSGAERDTVMVHKNLECGDLSPLWYVSERKAATSLDPYTHLLSQLDLCAGSRFQLLFHPRGVSGD